MKVKDFAGNQEAAHCVKKSGKQTIRILKEANSFQRYTKKCDFHSLQTNNLCC